MTSSFLVAAFAASLFFATLDLLRKFITRTQRPTVVVAYLVGGQFLIFGVWNLIDPVAWPPRDYWAPMSLAIVANFIANLLFLEALRRSHFSRTIPFLALSPAFAALAGLVVLDESLGLLPSIGIGLVVVGALAINLEPGAGAIRFVFQSLRREVGSVMMIGTAACWGIAAPFDKMALKQTELHLHALFMAGGIGLLLFLLMAWRGRLQELPVRGRPLVLLIVAVFVAMGALSLQLVAYGRGPVGIAETVKRVMGMTAAVVLGRLLFQEELTVAKLSGLVLMACGVAFIVI